jgi:hypothetical protein
VIRPASRFDAAPSPFDFDRKNSMKPLIPRASSQTLRQVALTLLIAPLCLIALPAFAQHDDHHDRDNHDGGSHRGDDRRNDHRVAEHGGNRYGRDYSYAQPVYVPAPVYRQPRPSPGISVFLPLDLRR